MANYIISSGITSSYVVSSGDFLEVQSGGTSSGSTILSGGTEEIDPGGKSLQDVVGGFQQIDSGGTASGTRITPGGYQLVFGAASDTVISGVNNSQGNATAQYIRNGGSGAVTEIDANGSQYVGDGSSGTATSTTINSDGLQAVGNNPGGVGTATSTTVNGGGTQRVGNGSNTRGTAIGTTINNGGVQYVGYDGGVGTAISSTVDSGGEEDVSSGSVTSDTTIAGGLLDLKSGAVTSGSIAFTAPGTLRVEAAVASGSSPSFASTVSSLAAGDKIDLTGFAYSAGKTSATVSDTTLTVTDGGATETFSLANRSAHYVSATNSGGHILLTAVSAVAPTIAGVPASTTTSGTTPVMPFMAATVTDLNDTGSDTDTLTIVQSGPGTLAGPGLGSGMSGEGMTQYILSGTAQQITGTLHGLTFTPAGGPPNSSATTTFSLTDTSPVYSGSAVISTAVIDGNAAVAPTVTGGGFTTTTQNAPVMPFSAASVGDPNANSTDTLSIQVQGGGTLSGAGLSGGANGLYMLSGTAGQVTSQLEALTFTPAANAPDTATTTTFTLTDTTTPGTSATNGATGVTDTVAAVAPTVTGGGSTGTTQNAPVMPFASASVGDPNANSTDTLSIQVQGTGTLSGAGLGGGENGLYALSGTAGQVTSQLQALTFTPAANAPDTTTSTSFTLTDTTTPGTSATNGATSVTDTVAAVAPTVTGGGSTSTTQNAPVMPFRAASVSDPNADSTDTLTIQVQGGGTLSGAGLSGGANGLYALSGTAAQVTGQLEALTFTPAADAPGTTTTTTFALTDTTTPGFSATNGATSVTDTVAPAPSPDTVSISPTVSYDHGVFTLTGTASSPAGVHSVEISAVLNDGARQSLGFAKVKPNGTFTFRDPIGADKQSFFVATLTDNAGNQAVSRDPGFNLTGGIGPRGDSGRQESFNATQQVSTTLFEPNGLSRTNSTAPGQTVELQPSGVVFNHDQGGTTFVYSPGGVTGVVDTIRGFKAGGTDHDVLSLKGADFNNSIANVLRDTGDVFGNAFVTDPVTGDAVQLAGVSKAQLKAHPKDIAFHA